MASQQDLLRALQQQLAHFDDDALIAVSNKGLLRRASKDLKTESPQPIDTSGQELSCQVGEVVVTMPLTGPTQARCSCPATTICRHILTVCLWLRAHARSSEPSPMDVTRALPAALHAEEHSAFSDIPVSVPPEIPDPPRISLLDYSHDQIVAWASKKQVRNAQERLAQGLSVQIEAGEPLVLHLIDLNLTCRYFSTTGLEGMICSCKAPQICWHRVMAVLSYRQQQGIEIDPPPPPSQARSPAEAPRSRDEVIVTTQRLLEEAIGVGITHLSEATQQRWQTLAVSATGVNLHRLSLLVRSLADDLGLSLRRDARADEERLFGSMARTYALCEALIQSPQRPDLVGQPRSRYLEVGTLDLVGVGAYHWQSRSGYAGLTVLFWEPAAQHWCTWSDARPQFHHSSFDPIARYHQIGPWDGIGSPAEAARNRVKLTGARRNLQRRLSSSKHTRGLTLGATTLDQLEFGQRQFADWSRLSRYLAATRPVGLQEGQPTDSIVVIRPAIWGERTFDAVTQVLHWELWDNQDRLLILRVPYRTHDIHRLRTLESLNLQTTALWGIVAQVYGGEDTLWIYPLSLLDQSNSDQCCVIDLGFSELKPSSPGSAPLPADLELAIHPPAEDVHVNLHDSETDPPDLAFLPDHPLLRTLFHIMDSTQQIAEGGSHRWSETLACELNNYSKVMEQTGMVIMSKEIQELARGLEIPKRVLRLRYLCQIAQESLANAQLR